MIATAKKIKKASSQVDSRYYYDESAANEAVEFFSNCLTLVRGKKGFLPYVPQQWEIDKVIKPIFGWKRANGFRKYRTVFIYVPRKNNKSTLANGILLACQYLDFEPGGQLYYAANDEKQARLGFGDAKKMVLANELLTEASTIYEGAILRNKSGSVIKPLSHDSNTKDGLDVHGSVIDEIHEWKKRDLYDKLKTASLARNQPLMVITTTAGTYDPTAIWMEVYDYAKKVKSGEIIDESFLPIIFEPDAELLASQDFDPFDEKLWYAVNPSLGTIIDIEDMRIEAHKAKNIPSYLNVFKRYYLNIITKSVDVFIPSHIWALGNSDRIRKDISHYAGRDCYIGVDLANYEDLVALSAVFPNKDGSIDVYMQYWVTYDKAIDRKTKNEADYFTWSDQGYVTIVPGNRHDYALIRNQISDINAIGCKIIMVGYDDWNASQFAQDLAADGININPWPPQNMKLWHKPTQNLESMAKNSKILHYANPVLSWNIENIAIRYNGEYIKPDKAKSRDKIDGTIALIIALGEWMNHQQTPDPNFTILWGN